MTVRRLLSVSHEPRVTSSWPNACAEGLRIRVKRVLVLSLALSAACASKESPGSTPGAARRPAPADPTLAEQAKQELLHAWNGYKRYAWGHDELMTVSKKPHDWYGKSRC